MSDRATLTAHRSGMSIKPGNPKYRCTFCRRWFLRSEGPAFSCCVLHQPGDCCHAFEIEVTKKGWVKRQQTSMTPPMVIRPFVGPMGSGSTTSAPWCSACGGFHIPGAGPCTGTYS